MKKNSLNIAAAMAFAAGMAHAAIVFDVKTDRPDAVYKCGEKAVFTVTAKDDKGAGPSAWGAAALMDAVDEGLAGIRDIDGLYRRIRFAPRWPVTPYAEGRYVTGYEISGKWVDVRWIFTDKGARYRLASPAEEVLAHLMVPEGKVPARLLVNGVVTPFEKKDVGGSLYVDAAVRPERGVADFEVVYADGAGPDCGCGQ